MRWLIAGLAVAGLALILWGGHIEQVGVSADDKLQAVYPWGAGAILLAIDAVLFIVAVVWRWF